MAREFWIGEWTSLKESPIWVERGETALGSEALSRHFCEFDVEGITRVEAACGVELSSLLLSSFLLLLSRVSGSESVTIVTSLGPVDSGQLLPLRFNIPSSRQFVELARDVAAKVSTAAKHMVFASRVIARDFPRLGSGNDTSLMDVGYRFCDATSVAASTSVEELLRSCHRDHTALLVLHGCKCVGRIAIAFECDREVFSETVINKLCDYLSAIIAAIIDDTTITVEEIPLEIEAQATLSFEDPDAGESFAF